MLQQRLPNEEWLRDAQRVPVGQGRRVYHGAESRPNLAVYNNSDSWSCWCHACGVGAHVPKQVLQAVPEAPPQLHKYLSASDCVTLSELARGHSEKFKRLVLLLHKKRMSTALISPYKPVYNLTDDRLVFTFNGNSVGRDCTERHHAKWFHYHSSTRMDFLYLQGENTYSTREPLILVEDLFSAIKVNKYTGYSTLWCCGTRMYDTIIAFCTEPSRVFYPILAFDGDDAGDKARRTASKRLGIRGVEFSAVEVPQGLDPKDLSCTELNELFNFLGEHHG